METKGVEPHIFRCSDALAQWPIVTVCVKRVPDVSENQRHVGIGYRTDDAHRLQHLAWHLKLTDVPLCHDPSYIGIGVNVPEMRQEEVSLLCERVFATNGRSIPYSFDAPNGCFDPNTGAALFGPTKLGLTCATFVLAVLEAAGIALIDYANWPANREGDDEWRAFVIGALAQEAANVEHVKAVRSATPGTRYRPEDVAAAAACFPPPATFDQTRPVVAEILSKLP